MAFDKMLPLNYFKILLLGCLFLIIHKTNQINKTIECMFFDKQINLSMAVGIISVNAINKSKNN